MTKRTVEVRGRTVEIEVNRKPGTKTVWIATGEYLGKRYESQGHRENDAVNRWREQARYHSG
jgi:hypothetical protein